MAIWPPSALEVHEHAPLSMDHVESEPRGWILHVSGNVGRVAMVGSLYLVALDFDDLFVVGIVFGELDPFSVELVPKFSFSFDVAHTKVFHGFDRGFTFYHSFFTFQ